MITINKKLCNSCGICSAICPNYVFARHDDQIFIRYADHCYNCGHCVAYCPNEAVEHDAYKNKLLLKQNRSQLSDSDVKCLLLNRRSVRAYAGKKISNRIMKELIDVACYAGSANNLQEESFIILSEESILRNLEDIIIQCLWDKGIKLFGKNRMLDKLLNKKFGAVLFNKYSRYQKIIKRRQSNKEKTGMIFRNAPSIIIVHGLSKNVMGPLNAAVALRNIEILALTKGIGACWAGLFVAAAQKSKKKVNPLIGIDENQTVYGALMVGYPKYQCDLQIPRIDRPMTII